MENSKVLKVILFLLGFALIVMGLWRIFEPIGFYAYSGIPLGDSANILNEARAAGGGIVGAGIVIVLGAFIKSLRYTSSIVCFGLFLSFGIARLIGIGIDGYPGDELVKGIVSEFLFGSIALVAFLKYRKK